MSKYALVINGRVIDVFDEIPTEKIRFLEIQDSGIPEYNPDTHSVEGHAYLHYPGTDVVKKVHNVVEKWVPDIPVVPVKKARRKSNKLRKGINLVID